VLAHSPHAPTPRGWPNGGPVTARRFARTHTIRPDPNPTRTRPGPDPDPTRITDHARLLSSSSQGTSLNWIHARLATLHAYHSHLPAGRMGLALARRVYPGLWQDIQLQALKGARSWPPLSVTRVLDAKACR